MSSRVRARKLLVEGATELRVIPYLMEANGIAWGPRENPVVHIAPTAQIQYVRQEKAPRKAGLSVLLDVARAPYIMPSIPPMPPGGIAGPSSFFGFSATVASVVISNPAIDAAF